MSVFIRRRGLTLTSQCPHLPTLSVKKCPFQTNWSSEEEALLQLLATGGIWRGSDIPDNVGTVKLKQAVTLEHMKNIWYGVIGLAVSTSAGSKVIVESSES